MTRPFGVSCAAFAVLAASIRGAAAQRQDSLFVPVDLAVAFARLYSPSDSAAAVRFVPDSIASPIRSIVETPPGSRVLGTVMIGRNTYLFATTAMTADSVIAWYGRDFGRRGAHSSAITRATIIVGAGGPVPPVGGFRPAAPARPVYFCVDSNGIDITANELNGLTTLRLRVVQNGFPCNVVPSNPVRAPASRAPLPILYNPAGGVAGPQCFVISSTQHSQTQLVTEFSPSALLDHYGKQLATQGWAPMQGDYPIARALWSRRDSTGVTEVAAVTVGISPTAPMCRDGTLDVFTLRSR